MSSINVCVSFPKVSNVRIGSAMRLVVKYYIELNKLYDGYIDEEKIEKLLLELPSVYRFNSLIEYSNYILEEFLDAHQNVSRVKFEGIDSINKKSEKFGSTLIPIKMLNFLNANILKRLSYLLLQEIESDEVHTFSFVIEHRQYAKIFEKDEVNDDFKLAMKFIEGLRSWLEYNMIIRVVSFYIDPKTFDIVFPVRFSFLQSSK